MHATSPKLSGTELQKALQRYSQETSTPIPQIDSKVFIESLSKKGQSAELNDVELLKKASQQELSGKAALQKMGTQQDLKPTPKTELRSGTSAFSMLLQSKSSKPPHQRRGSLDLGKPRSRSPDPLSSAPLKLEAPSKKTPPKPTELGTVASRAILTAETGYAKKALRYAEEIGDDLKLKSEELEPIKTHGMAPGMSARSMRFTPDKTTPSKALDGFFKGPTVCECHGLMQAVMYQGVRGVLKDDELFDKAFSKMTIAPEFLNPFNNPIDKVISKQKLSGPEDLDKVQVGDWLYVRNRSDYKDKHPAGAAAGWNIMCVDHSETGEPLFIGFGLSDKAKAVRPLKLDEIKAILLEYHEEPPTQEDLRLAKGVDKLSKRGVVDLQDLLRSTGKKGGATEPFLDLDHGIKRLSAQKLKALLG